VLYRDGRQIFYRADLGVGAAKSLRDIVETRLHDLKRDILNSDVTVQPYYQPARLEDREIEYLNLVEVSELRSRLTPLETPKKLDTVTDEDLISPNMLYYVISVRPQNGPWLHLFRLVTRGSQPQRTKVAFIKGHATGYFDTLSDPVYLLDPRNIDCMLRGEHLFIIDKVNFERMFALGDDAQESARTVMDYISCRLPFANVDDFILACQRDRRMAAKVAGMKGVPNLDQLSIEKAKLAKERYDLDIEIEQAANGTERLRFIPRYKWQYVSIICDEYVTSPYTGQDYESNSKRPIKKRSKVVGRRTWFQDLATFSNELSQN